MGSLRLILLATAWAVAAHPSPGQLPGRLLSCCDGHPLDDLRTEGAPSWVSDRADLTGLRALRVAPGEAPYYGATFRDLPVADPEFIHLRVFLEGDRNATFRLRLDGVPETGPRPSARQEVEVHPGWNMVRVPLRGLSDQAGSPWSAGERLGWVQFSARAHKNAPPFWIDAVSVEGEPSAEALQAQLRKALAAEGERERRWQVGRLLAALSEPTRVEVALRLLGQEQTTPGVRRAAREILSRTHSAEGLAKLRAAVRKTHPRIQSAAAWAFGATSSRDARSEARLMVAEGAHPLDVRTALLTGLARPAAEDASTLPWVDLHWPAQAAWVAAQRMAATPTAVDALIGVLEKSLPARIRDDVIEALVSLTGQDHGATVAAWRAWWDENRGKVALGGPHPVQRVNRYGTYYGIPIPEGRITFVLDLSGSMRDPVGGGAAQEHINRSPHLKGQDVRTRLDLARRELTHALGLLRSPSAVAVVTYDDAAEAVVTTQGPEAATESLREKLIRRVQTLTAQGRTNIHDGLLRAFYPDKEPSRTDVARGPDTVFLLTDGEPSVGPVTNRAELRDLILEWNLTRWIRIHAINVGARDSRWLTQVSAESGGTFYDLTSQLPREDEKK